MFYKTLLRKIGITILFVLIYRMAMLIVLPGIDLDILNNVAANDGILKTINFFSGGGIDKCSILALNIMPYISASIVTQLLSSKNGLEFFQNLKKDREIGSAKLNLWTQFFTVIIALLNAIYYTNIIFAQNQMGANPIYIQKWLFFLVSIPTLVTGSLLVVWFANQISKFGIGQGTSIILFINILSTAPGGISNIYDLYSKGMIPVSLLIYLVLFFLVLFVIVLFVEGSNRFVNIIHPGLESQRVIQHLPMKINNAGVIPVVMASSLSHFPVIVLSVLKQLGFYTETWTKYVAYCSPGGYFYYVFMSFLLLMLCISQTYIVFDPNDVARNLQESNVLILNVRPGQATVEYLTNLLNRLNVIAGIYLITVCVFSEYICSLFNNAVGVEFLHFGGTSILIGVNVAQLIFKGMKNYDYNKFLPQAKQ